MYSLSASLLLCVLLLVVASVVLSSSEKNNDVSVIRQANNNGFHRDVTTTVQLQITNSEKLIGCDVVLLEHFPSSVYVDPFQIQRVEYSPGAGILARFTGPVDIESPTEYSEPLPFSVYSVVAKHGTYVGARVKLPVHLRYHVPKHNQDYIQVKLPHPDVLIKCDAAVTLPATWQPHKHACSHNGTDTCTWHQVPADSTHKLPGDDLAFQVPVGRQEHLIIVIVVTFIVTITGTIVLIPVIVIPCKNK